MKKTLLALVLFGVMFYISDGIPIASAESRAQQYAREHNITRRKIGLPPVASQSPTEKNGCDPHALWPAEYAACVRRQSEGIPTGQTSPPTTPTTTAKHQCNDLGKGTVAYRVCMASSNTGIGVLVK